MNIIYLGSFRFPHGDAASARVLNVARALRLAGHEVSFVAWGGNYRSEDMGIDGIYRIDGFPYMITNELDFKGGAFSKAKSWLSQGRKSKQILKDRLGQYDAVICYNCSIVRWLVGFCRRNHLFLISDLTEWYACSELKMLELPGYLWDMYVSQRNVRNKIVISSFLAKYYYSSHNIVIPATCDSQEVKWNQSEDYAKSIVGSFNGITLVYAGTPAHKDAIHYAISAVQRLIDEGANIRFVIVGITREAYLKKYRNLLSKTELSDKIQFAGRVSQEQVPSFYTLADFMVLLREQTRKSNAGFPTKFSESFISGTPVIANLTSDLGSYLKDEQTGFVVDEPSEESVYHILKEKVIGLSRDRITVMKENVHEAAKQLDYHAYVEPLSTFLKHLK